MTGKTLEGFGIYLRENTKMEETTIRQYVYAAARFDREVKFMDKEHINHFLSNNTRDKYNYLYKYAVKHYLTYLGKKELTPDLVKIKIRPRKKTGNFYEPEVVWEIINGLKVFRLPAIIQYVSGARPAEALSLERDKVRRNTRGLSIILTGKGGKESEVNVLPSPEADYIFEEVRKSPEKYPFLKGTPRPMLLWVNTTYRYYLRELSAVRNNLGVRFSPHDFRRNFAEEIKLLSNGNMYAVKLALRHSQFSSTERYVRQVIDPDLQQRYMERIGEHGLGKV